MVQMDFTEARLTFKIDPTGALLKEFIDINNRVLDRFSKEDQTKLGVHVCPGGDCDCYVSVDHLPCHLPLTVSACLSIPTKLITR